MDNWNQIFTYSIRLSFLLISFLCYIMIIVTIMKYKLYRIQAGALYLGLSFLQAFMIFLPTILILLIDIQPVQEGVLCTYQSYSVLVGYIWASGISLLMAIIVLRTYYFKQSTKEFLRLFTIIWLIQFVLYLVINQFLFNFTPKRILFYIKHFLYTLIKLKLYNFVQEQTKVNTFMVFVISSIYSHGYLLGLNFFYIIRFQIYKRNELLESQNIYIKEVILSVQYLGGSQIILFSFNQLLKVLDHFINGQLWLDIILYFLNEIYSLEGLLVTYIFLTSFQGYLKVRAPQLYFLLPNYRAVIFQYFYILRHIQLFFKMIIKLMNKYNHYIDCLFLFSNCLIFFSKQSILFSQLDFRKDNSAYKSDCLASNF